MGALITNIHLFTFETKLEFLESATGPEGSKRTARDALLDPAVDRDVKDGVRMMQIVSQKIPGTPAERDVYQRQLMWQTFAHGVPVAFGTPNTGQRDDPVFAACASSPGPRRCRAYASDAHTRKARVARETRVIPDVMPCRNACGPSPHPPSTCLLQEHPAS